MSINLHLPSQNDTLRPRITVIGVGGAGGNAVNNMISSRLEGVEFVVANTDAQALDAAMTDRAIQLGANVTRGLGAGADPSIGKAAAEEALDELVGYMQGSNMLFITAGMGGGTGTGAAPVVAKAAKDQGILTVGVVTKPFQFEGGNRMRLAEEGLKELQEYVDTLIVIPNQNLFRLANDKTTFADAFRMADEVLHSGVRGVTDLMVKPGLVNLDFADIRTVMREMGKAMMGTGEASGDKRAVDAAESAISNPLLDDVSLKGARAALINITGGADMTLFEVDEAANRIREEIDSDANIIFGSTFNDEMDGLMRVSVVATGIDAEQMKGTGGGRQASAAATGNVARPGGAAQASRPFSYAPAAAAAGASSQAPAARPAARPQASNPAPVQKTAAPAAAPVSPVARNDNSEAVPTFSSGAASRVEPKEEVAATAAPSPEAEAPQAAEAENHYPESETAEDVPPLFMSPRPSRPVKSEAIEAAPSVALAEEGTEEGVATAERSGGLFGKIAEVGRAISSRIEGDYAEEYEDEYYDEAEGAISDSESASSEEVLPQEAAHEAPVSAAETSEGDDYDIPAFLRRQAN